MQARSQTTNTVTALASTVGAYMYIRLYMHIKLCYTCTIYIILVRTITASALFGPQNHHPNHITLYNNTAQNILHRHTFLENEFFPTSSVQQRQHVDQTGCHTFITGLISMSDFDILRIPSGGTKICIGCTAPMHPLAPR